MAGGARPLFRAGRTLALIPVAGFWGLTLLFGHVPPCHAGGASIVAVPQLGERTDTDDQNYSYYYVPHLSELNRLVGYILRSGLVRLTAPAPEAAITRYAAYSCDGTLYAGAVPARGVSLDIDWSTVTALRSGPAVGPPSLVIERESTASSLAQPLVLYFADATTRYQLHQALAVS